MLILLSKLGIVVTCIIFSGIPPVLSAGDKSEKSQVEAESISGTTLGTDGPEITSKSVPASITTAVITANYSRPAGTTGYRTETADVVPEVAVTRRPVDPCWSLPCWNLGTCYRSRDVPRGYYCACHPDYTGQDCEILINVCSRNECGREGTCRRMSDTDYRCLCGPCYHGSSCRVKNAQACMTVYPNWVHVSGGHFTVSMEYHSEKVKEFILNNETMSQVKYSKVLENKIYLRKYEVVLPPIDPSIIGVKMPLVAVFATYDVSLGDFTIRSNPVISSIFPLKTITSGGTTITVKGNHLDTVDDPFFQITAIDRTSDLKTIYQSSCSATNPTVMLCQTPILRFNDEINVTTGRVTKRNVEDKSKYDIYIGFKLGNFDQYKNLSESLPDYSNLQVFRAPTVQTWEKPITHHKYSGDTVVVYGEGFDVGVLVTDYRVTVGGDECGDVEITSNTITCYPPDSEPAPAESNQDKYAVMVYIGRNLRFHIGYLRYKFTATRAAFIAIGIGLALVIVSITVVAVLCHIRKKRDQPPSLDEVIKAIDNKSQLGTMRSRRSRLAGGSIPGSVWGSTRGSARGSLRGSARESVNARDNPVSTPGTVRASLASSRRPSGPDVRPKHSALPVFDLKGTFPRSRDSTFA